MIKEVTVKIKGHPRNIKYYKSFGYNIEVGGEVDIKTSDLMRGSSVKITTICDYCFGETNNTFKDYYSYTNGLVNPFYCIRCKTIKSEKTCLEKWGVSNPMKSEIVKNKIRLNNIESIGVDSHFKLKSVKEKIEKTNLEKWGVNNPFKSDIIKEKIKKTNLEKWGVEYPTQSDEIMNKIKNTNMEKYGYEFYSKTNDWLYKVNIKNLSNYGYLWMSQSDIIKEKVKKTNNIKYGSDSYLSTIEFKNNLKSKRQRNTWKKFIDLIGSDYKIDNYSDEIFNIFHNKCDSNFEISKSLLSARIKLKNILCANCNPIGVQKSSIEREVMFFLDENKISYISGDRSVLNGKEIDIYLPDYKIALEVNGLYWHSELYKGQKYHLNKTLECNKIGIHLIHIWEDDWKLKCDILKSIILNKLGIINNRIYARKCNIKEVPSNIARNFLDQNHIQGFSSSSIKIGLYNCDELVSLMTFGWRKTNGKREYELIRFCNKKNFNIIGGASKLFKYFINNNSDFSEIISYADISIFDGGLYKKLNFEKVSLSKPNYFWVIDSVRSHRYNWSKKKLVNKGYDPNKSEVEIMSELGYYRVFSCGQEKWIYKK